MKRDLNICRSSILSSSPGSTFPYPGRHSLLVGSTCGTDQPSRLESQEVHSWVWTSSLKATHSGVWTKQEIEIPPNLIQSPYYMTSARCRYWRCHHQPCSLGRHIYSYQSQTKYDEPHNNLQDSFSEYQACSALVDCRGLANSTKPAKCVVALGISTDEAGHHLRRRLLSSVRSNFHPHRS